MDAGVGGEGQRAGECLQRVFVFVGQEVGEPELVPQVRAARLIDELGTEQADVAPTLALGRQGVPCVATVEDVDTGLGPGGTAPAKTTCSWMRPM